MNYCNIKRCDIANGEGVRVTLFVSGCTHHCKGCFQPETWDFAYGDVFDTRAEDIIMSELEKSYVSGLTLLGGEPFEPENQRALLPFLRRVRDRFPQKTIWAFSGYTWEELIPSSIPMLRLIDVLVDGEFVEDLRNISLRFRGSENQRIIDVRRTLETNVPVLWQ